MSASGKPDGGALRGDSWSDPRDQSGYSAEDLISLGFVSSPTVRRRLRRPQDPAVLDRGRGEADREHQLHRQPALQPHAVRDGNLITGQQQYSGEEAARLMIEALGL